MRGVCYEVWEGVLEFLTTLVQTQCGQAVEVLAHMLHKQWSPIAGTIVISTVKTADKELENENPFLIARVPNIRIVNYFLGRN